VYNNLANNAYIITKFLRKNNFDAEAGLIPDDRFPMSQPIWEDLDFELPITIFKKNYYEEWRNFEKKMKFKKPHWVQYIGKSNSSRQKLIKNNLAAMFSHPLLSIKAMRRTPIGFFNYLNTFLNLTKIIAIRKYDFIIGFGTGPLIAYLAGKKYASIPYGSDLSELPFYTTKSSKLMSARAKLQRIAYKNSKIIFIGNDPNYIEYLKKIGILENWVYFPFPIDYEVYRPIPEEDFSQLVDSKIMSKIKNKIVFLMPSRIDFNAKGNDKVLRAFAKLVKKRNDVYLIMLGWGDDLEKAKNMIFELDLQNFVYFHPFVISKKRLIRFVNASDVILDQFSSSGAYGTTTMETMSCGKPLITYINFDKLKKYHTGSISFKNAFTESEIYQAMLFLCNKEQREILGKNARNWLIENHSSKTFSNSVEILEKAFTIEQ